MKIQDQYDYVIVGGGSSGCVIASRLANEKSASVLLLEAGYPAEKNPETLSADGFKDAFANDDCMWDRMTAPQDDCGSRPLYAGTGTGMGGSGSVNGMVYTRGDKLDFEQWPRGWKWDDVTPAFEALEKKLAPRNRLGTPFTGLCIKAAENIGFKRKDGLNDGDLSGYVGYNDMNYREDKRRSSYVAYVTEQDSQNLTTLTQASVQSFKLSDEAEPRVEQVYFKHQNESKSVSVKHEVIMCAGALETPKLLILSGIGPKQELSKWRIPLRVNSPGIGQNLHDHPNVCIFYKAKNKIDFNYPQLYSFDRVNPALDLPKEQADTCIVYFSAPSALKQSMKRMVPVLGLPGKFYNFRFLRSLLRSCIDAAFLIPALQNYVSKVFGIVVILGKPLSKGTVSLNSVNPNDQARIDPAYYSNPEDMNSMVLGVKKAHEIAKQSELQEWGSKTLSPATLSDDDKDIAKWISGATMTTFHFCGSCSMGESAEYPVDLKLKLKGLQNLRVADASVIPEVPVSAINAPSMMIGWRAAEFIMRESANNTKTAESPANAHSAGIL